MWLSRCVRGGTVRQRSLPRRGRTRPPPPPPRSSRGAGSSVRVRQSRGSFFCPPPGAPCSLRSLQRKETPPPSDILLVSYHRAARSLNRR
jgi:hypothetical protein